MRLPILYTLTWPERFEASEKTWPRLDFLKMGDLTFKEPDHAKYPAMELAYAAGRAGGTMTGVCCPACCLVPYSICVVLAVVSLMRFGCVPQGAAEAICLFIRLIAKQCVRYFCTMPCCAFLKRIARLSSQLHASNTRTCCLLHHTRGCDSFRGSVSCE